jgi:hypothetical protein
MKTRTLLLLAVTCGLVILVAGSIKLFLLTDASPPAHLSIGQTTKIGDMTVTVLSAKRTNELTLVSVRLVGADDSNGAATWVFGAGTTANLLPVPPPGTAGPACGATKATVPTTCVLAFRSTDPSGVLRYERAQEHRYWDIVGT